MAPKRRQSQRHLYTPRSFTRTQSWHSHGIYAEDLAQIYAGTVIFTIVSVSTHELCLADFVGNVLLLSLTLLALTIFSLPLLLGSWAEEGPKEILTLVSLLPPKVWQKCNWYYLFSLPTFLQLCEFQWLCLCLRSIHWSQFLCWK